MSGQSCPTTRFPEFLDRVWTKAAFERAFTSPASFCSSWNRFFSRQPIIPSFFLDEEGQLADPRNRQCFYETKTRRIHLAGPNPDFQTGSYTCDGQTYLVRRHQDEEAQLINELTSMQFQSRSNKLWFLEPEEAIAFCRIFTPRLSKAIVSMAKALFPLQDAHGPGHNHGRSQEQ